MAAAGSRNGKRRPTGRKPRGDKAAAPATEAPASAEGTPANDAGPAAGTAPGTALKVFQIFFEPWQRELLDPAFVPLDNRGQATELLEFDLFERLSLSEHVEGAALWGALSWRFTEKTGLTGAVLQRTIDAQPGFDVYFCNPYPVNEAIYHNLWSQGETSHPRFLPLVRAFLEAAGLPDETQMIVPSQLFSSANYFVATPAFWRVYLPWVRAVLAAAEAALAPDLLRELHSVAADDRNLHAGQTYLPFIVERLFALFMRSAGKELRGYKLPLPVPEEQMNVHLKLLREMKDVAWANKNAWLAACWVNYRNLYLQQANGREWTQQYLRAVTPTDIRFA